MADETTVEVTKKITKKTKKKKVTIQEDFNTEERSGSIDQGSSEQPAENHTLTIEEVSFSTFFTSETINFQFKKLNAEIVEFRK